MLVLVTYDVNTSTAAGTKRLRKVAKECINYGQRVQNSVFECIFTESQFLVLKHKLEKIIDVNADSIRFYFMGNNWERKIEQLGRETSYNVNAELII